MPCRDYGPTIQDTQYQERIDFLARIACKAMTAIEEAHLAVNVVLTAEEKAWWKNHKEMDFLRLERDRKKKQKEELLSRLTPLEREILGV